MTKLHEILAVTGDLTSAATKINDETMGVFRGKPEQFLQFSTDIHHLTEDMSYQDGHEYKALTTTVHERLRGIVPANVRAFDIYLRREASNLKAMADIEIDGKVIAKNVPAAALLGIMRKLEGLKAVYESIPTLAPGTEWVPDTTLRTDGSVFRAKYSEVRFRSKKIVRPLVLSPATEHHPAQVQTISEDVASAKVTTQTWSGMISSAHKADLLERVDKLYRAVKRANQRANDVDIDSRSIGADLFRYLHDGIVP